MSRKKAGNSKRGMSSNVLMRTFENIILADSVRLSSASEALGALDDKQ